MSRTAPRPEQTATEIISAFFRALFTPARPGRRAAL